MKKRIPKPDYRYRLLVSEVRTIHPDGRVDIDRVEDINGDIPTEITISGKGLPSEGRDPFALARKIEAEGETLVRRNDGSILFRMDINMTPFVEDGQEISARMTFSPLVAD